MLRGARRAPVIGAAVAAVDRVWWLRLILRSGLVDAGYYAAQRGWRRAGTVRAAVDYVLRGYREGLSPNPLFDEAFVSRALPDSGRVPALYAFLVGHRPSIAVHPWWPTVDGRPSGGMLERVWAARADAVVEATIGPVTVRIDVARWRRIVVDAQSSDRVGDPRPAGGDGTVIRFLQHGDPRTDERIVPLAALPDGYRVRLVQIGTTAGTWATTALAARMLSHVSAVRLDPAIGFGDALARCAGDVDEGVLVSLDPRVTVDAEQIIRLATQGRDALVTPVVLDSDGTVAGLGAAVVVTDRARLARPLRGHPVEDLAPAGDAPFVPQLLSGRTFAGPASVFRADTLGAGHRGHELEVLSARAAARGLALRVDVGTVVGGFAEERVFADRATALPAELAAVGDDRRGAESLYGRCGFVVTGWDAAGEDAVPQVTWVRPHQGARRWAIKTSAPAGPRGDVWGDAHFARGLAAALRRRGHHVVVDAFEAAGRTTSALDDVHVVIRGPFRIEPPENGVRVEWIISHPDEITPEEVRGFDLVLAVSPGWAQRRSAEWGVPIEPLLECTDTDLFHPAGRRRTDEVVFVGTARGIARPSVVAPLRAGIDVKVYGPDWRGFIPGSAIVAPAIPNADLPERYETASVVLNDHWPAMRAEGFHAMRPYDVVAAGGRVISESIEGLSDVFGAAVVEYRDPEELVALLRGDLDALFPPDDELARISARIRAEHSFDARAARLDALVSGLAGTAG